ncbi:hypothetical protein KZP23_07190 [Echinicola marina]|uniref:hypothetical protein n=1 Tax=Echinicola marina TaxID=2859768 RepID=UPI001CF637F6|nr:hypothetical protein [Echinicola marina]UCS94786.1 hypothetical protein KZP23_07190 [Echinicola marina]
MAKKPKKEENPKVNPELEGFKMNINSFGEISSSFSIDKINEFLNKNVEDKKLKDRDDLDEVKKSKKE